MKKKSGKTLMQKWKNKIGGKLSALDKKKLVLTNIPYALAAFYADRAFFLYRNSPGEDMGNKLLYAMEHADRIFAGFVLSNNWKDLLAGIVVAVVLKVLVWQKQADAKKLRKGIEYGSARWGTAEDIKPYMSEDPWMNIPLTATEALTMESRPKQPKYARNKNIVVIGGSGSGKTRFFVKPSVMQMNCSMVITDPKGTLIEECGKMLAKGPPKKDKNGNIMKDKSGKVVHEPYEFHDMGAYEKSTDVNQIAAVYEKYRENPENAYRVCSMGIIYRDPEDSYYDDAEFAIVKGNTVLGNLMDDVRFYGELALVREGIEKIHEALPDYKYVPMRDVREAMYPEKMTTEQLAEALDEIAEAFDPYEYRDNVETGENTVQEVMLDLQSGNTHSYISYLKDIVDEECDQSVRAGVLIERLKAYEPELPKDMEPMVYVNYCEKSELGNPRCQKLSDLDSKTVEQDKAWYADCDPNTNEPKTTAQMFFTVYYAEKGDKMLHHFQGKIDIGSGNGGIISQLKMQNEMKLTDESWISYQQGKGNEEYQKYMEDLTDMQNHVLPYLQSFCSLEEKGVKERREQQVAEKNESREAVSRAGVEINTAVKDAGKAERKAVAQKKAMPGKEKKPSIHERLEINKRIIQEKQGKDKPERGADLGVRTV
ncbi:LPD25 domain-containing protein [Blautia sp. Sow4_E7]|uniref:LPD25 domain-containing protein n=1 Tax=Blautia sp. Sow4_E7 TaxID=3438749 RepID=UPI003F910DDE